MLVYCLFYTRTSIYVIYVVLLYIIQLAVLYDNGLDISTLADPTPVSEIEDANNDGNFSENAWDNYQVNVLY